MWGTGPSSSERGRAGSIARLVRRPVGRRDGPQGACYTQWDFGGCGPPRTRHKSPRDGAARATGGSGGGSEAEPNHWSVKQPRPARDERSSIVGIPISAATRSATLTSDSSSCTMSALAGRSSNSKFSSSEVRAVLSGAYAHERQSARNAIAHSGPLLSTAHTLSTCAIPKDASSCSSTNWRSSRCESVRPSAE